MALPELLSTLTESLTSALDALPSPTTLATPDDGLSLLSTKNELLLAYLQNLIFFIVLKLRALAADPDPAPLNPPTTTTTTADDDTITTTDTAATDPIHDAVIQNLVALGVYLEKGVRPLETRLTYQIDKLLLAATTASPPVSKPTISSLSRRHASASLSPTPSSASKIPPLAHRPNPTSLLAPPAPPHSTSATPTRYRPPHITPTAPPRAHAETQTQRARKSATMEEFVRDEMGDAPVPEPSVGAGSGLSGKEARRESERRGYEEGRLVRLGVEKGVGKRKRGGAGGEGDIWGVGFEEGEADGRRGKKVRGGKKRGGMGARGRR